MKIDIVIYADVLCPWCFIQKRSLEDAMQRYQARHPEVEFEVRWKPYLLYPTLRNGEKSDVYERTMSCEKFRLFVERIARAGYAHNIAFSFGGSTGASQAAHALLQRVLSVLGPAAQDSAVETVFRGHFEEGRDVTDLDWLVAVGRGVGLGEDEARAAVEGRAERRMVEDHVKRAVAEGVEAVPCVMVQGKFRVGGFQEGRVFEEVFRKAGSERASG